MKIETREPEFKPVVILIESKEELSALSWIVRTAYAASKVGTQHDAMCEELISGLDL